MLATKVHGKMGEGPNDLGNSRRHIIEQCEASLRRLQTDCIDLYQIHRPDSQIPIDETLRAMDDLIRSGKVRYIGTSTYAAWQLVESLWVSKENGLHRFVCEQPPYNLLDRRIERELIPMAQTYGFGIIPWSPLAGGLLTGKYHRGEPPPADTRFGAMASNPIQQRRWSERVFDVIDGLMPIAEREGRARCRSYRWHGARSSRGSRAPIIGPRTMEQLEDNLKAWDVTITDEDRERIDHVSRRGEMVSRFYEADFGPHPFRV